MDETDPSASPSSDDVCDALSTAHVRDDVLLRVTLAPLPKTLTAQLRCRADYGVAAASSRSSLATATPAQPAALAQFQPATINAVAAYGFSPGTTCAPPILR